MDSLSWLKLGRPIDLLHQQNCSQYLATKELKHPATLWWFGSNQKKTGRMGQILSLSLSLWPWKFAQLLLSIRDCTQCDDKERLWKEWLCYPTISILGQCSIISPLLYHKIGWAMLTDTPSAPVNGCWHKDQWVSEWIAGQACCCSQINALVPALLHHYMNKYPSPLWFSSFLGHLHRDSWSPPG